MILSLLLLFSSMTATVVSVYDGDTIKVDIAGCPALFCKNISVRILGIDTPELRGKCANEKALARRALTVVESIITKGSLVTLVNPDRDKYFRIVADVFYGNINIGQELIKRGLAVPYDGGTKASPWC